MRPWPTGGLPVRVPGQKSPLPDSYPSQLSVLPKRKRSNPPVTIQCFPFASHFGRSLLASWKAPRTSAVVRMQTHWRESMLEANAHPFHASPPRSHLPSTQTISLPPLPQPDHAHHQQNHHPHPCRRQAVCSARRVQGLCRTDRTYWCPGRMSDCRRLGQR